MTLKKLTFTLLAIVTVTANAVVRDIPDGANEPMRPPVSHEPIGPVRDGERHAVRAMRDAVDSVSAALPKSDRVRVEAIDRDTERYQQLERTYVPSRQEFEAFCRKVQGAQQCLRGESTRLRIDTHLSNESRGFHPRVIDRATPSDVMTRETPAPRGAVKPKIRR